MTAHKTHAHGHAHDDKDKAAATAKSASKAGEAGDLPDALKMIERFLPAEAAPLFDLFDGEFTRQKLWPAFTAIGLLGPKIDRVLEGAFPGGTVPEGEMPHFAATMPASTRSPAENCASAKELLEQAEPAPVAGSPGAAGEDADPRPAVVMNPFLAAALAALIKDVAAEIIRRLSGG